MKISCWNDVPEPVLHAVLKLLKVSDVLSSGRTCRRWNEISRDGLLWKFLLQRDFRPDNLTPKTDAVSWYNEYVRLVDRVPVVKIQSLGVHSDEILHVAFSNDSREMVSCSKDHRVIVWRRDEREEQFSQHFCQDMSQFYWIHTWASQFNKSDTMLMVAGVINQVTGEIAIFSTGRVGASPSYSLICRVPNDPYDVMGCWCSENYFLSGTMTLEAFDNLTAQIFLCAPVASEDQQLLNVQCYKRLVFKYLNMAGTIHVRNLKTHHRRKFHDGDADWRDVESVAQRIDLNNEDQEELSEADLQQLFDDDDLCIIFMCGDKTRIPHQIGFHRLNRERLKSPLCLRRPEKVIEFFGHVIGMAVSKDERYLFVNVRSWPENAIPRTDQAPPIASQVEIHVIDLKDFSRVRKPLSGHRGYTPSEQAFYLYVDTSDNLVASGSEDHQGYIWDRHYGALVSRLKHDDCVNSVAFCPSDEEICVTASDDHTVSVWASRRKVREKRLGNR